MNNFIDKILKKVPAKNLTLNKIFLFIAGGIALVILAMPMESFSSDSSKKESESQAGDTGTVFMDYKESLENQLEEALATVSGVGKVKVMITLKNNGEKVLTKQKNESYSGTNESDSQGGVRSVEESMVEESVVYDGDSPYVVEEKYPEVEGVIVIMEGGQNADKAAEINEAVKALFGIESNKIKVMKYGGN